MLMNRLAVTFVIAAAAGSLLLAAPVYAEVEVFQNGPGAETEATVLEETEPVESQQEAFEEEIITREVGITEKFHSEFDLYEGSIQDKYFFYSNISNGGITSEPVYFELPAELQVLAEKDGASVAYTSGQELRESGNYLIHFTASEQVDERRRIDYKAVFRFKIQEKAKEPSSDGETEVEENGVSVEEEETAGILEAAEEQLENGGHGNGMRDEDNYYHYTFQNGLRVISSVPDGMITAKEVSLEIGGDEDYRIYKDNDLIEWEKKGILQDRGDYVVASGGEVFCFRISGYLSNTSWYYPPDGFRIKTAEFQNNQILVVYNDRMEVRRDGKYQLELESEDGFILECSFERDTVPPEYEIELYKKGAAVTYLSNDIDSVTVYKDGKETGASYNNVYEEGGRYRLVVCDLAGNQVTKEFKVSFHMNSFTIVLIVLVILAAAVAITWLSIMKKKIRVR